MRSGRTAAERPLLDTWRYNESTVLISLFNVFMRRISLYFIFIVAAGALTVSFWLYQKYFRSEEGRQLSFVVERGDIEELVRVRGEVVPEKEFDLSFPSSGIIARIAVREGQGVAAGSVLAELDRSELQAQLLEADAGAAAERAKLEEMKRGSRVEDIDVKRAELEKARQDLANLHTGTPNVLKDAYTKADDAVRAKTAGIFSGSKTTFYALTFSACDDQARIDATSGRLAADVLLDAWRAELDAISALSKREELEAALRKAENHLAQVRSFLDDLNDVLTAGCTLNNSSLDTYRTNVSTGRANVNTAIANANGREEDIASQKTTVAKIEKELTLKLAGAAPEEIAAQEAQLRQAEAKAQLTRAQLAKAVLRAPFAAKVVKVHVEQGEISQPGTPAVSLASAAFRVQADVSELDIGKVRETNGNEARLRLDAFPGREFEGTVVSVDPQEIDKEGDKYFRVNVVFDATGVPVRSGMSADLVLKGVRKEGVLKVPEIAVYAVDDKRFVRVLEDGSEREVEVETGITDDESVEIVSGLREGQIVVVSSD